MKWVCVLSDNRETIIFSDTQKEFEKQFKHVDDQEMKNWEIIRDNSKKKCEKLAWGLIYQADEFRKD